MYIYIYIYRQTCEVKCAVPYYGTATPGSCPANNTDPRYVLQWSRPQCTLMCRVPEPFPEGYVYEDRI